MPAPYTPMEQQGRRQKDAPADAAPLQRVEAFLRLVEAAEGAGEVPWETLPAGAAARLLGGAARRGRPPGREGGA